MSEEPSPSAPGAPVRLAVVVLGMWPYRNRFYDEVAGALGVASEVVVFASDARYYRPEEGLKRIRVVEVPALRGRRGILASSWPNPALWRQLSAFAPTHVWVHEFSPYVLLAWAWAKVHRRPCIVSTEIGDRFPARYLRLNKARHNRLKPYFSGVVAHTQAAYETAAKVARRAVFVPHGIDTNLYRPRNADGSNARVRLLQVGGLNERKGVDLLLRAFRRCVDAQPGKLELVLLGEGEGEWVEGLIQEMDLGEHVRIHPFVQGQELIEEYRRADIFVHASREDTYAVVVHEAAACGLPLVVSRYAGASETLVEEGRSGWVVDPYDAEGFAAAILRLAADDSLRKSCGQAARERAERFSVQRNGARVVGWLRAEL